jgi:hypothetical protein
MVNAKVRHSNHLRRFDVDVFGMNEFIIQEAVCIDNILIRVKGIGP